MGPAQCPIPSSFLSKSVQVPLYRHKRMAPVPANRGPPRPKSERRGEAGVPPHRPGAAVEGAGPQSPLGNMSDMMLRDARIHNPGPTVHFSARGRRLTPKAEGHAGSLSGGPGLGVPRHPHPRQSRSAESEPGSKAWRGRAAWGPLW